MLVPSTVALPSELDVEKLLCELTLEEKVALTAGKCAIFLVNMEKSRIKADDFYRQRLLAYFTDSETRNSFHSSL
jgi:hypothetical protein